MDFLQKNPTVCVRVLSYMCVSQGLVIINLASGCELTFVKQWALAVGFFTVFALSILNTLQFGLNKFLTTMSLFTKTDFACFAIYCVCLGEFCFILSLGFAINLGYNSTVLSICAEIAVQAIVAALALRLVVVVIRFGLFIFDILGFAMLCFLLNDCDRIPF